MVRIIEIESGGIAEELDIRPGDYVVSVNGRTIGDRLDYRFYINEEHVDVTVQRGEEQTVYEIEKEPDDDLGIVLDEMKLKACGNNCVFCFVYQNPKGMRKPLYFKDEDYRFSFMYGHYVTMTTLKQKDLDRIVEQRLSPLYISVHATEEKTRQLLLGIKRDDHLLEKIDFLTKNGIELHAQIVLCPGINDGAVFDQTVEDLKQFYPGVKSIAVVPVGLTQHRNNLYPLRRHSPAELRDMIAYTNAMRRQLKAELGVNFVYLSDEFYIKAEHALPGHDYYDEFYQIENGVGEFRDMIDRFNLNKHQLPSALPGPVRIAWVTGTLAAGPLQTFIIEPLKRIENLHIDLIPVRNDFYGPSIEVSGLLTAQDIATQVTQHRSADLVLLPPRVLNDDGLFLDDQTVEDLQKRLKRPCHVYKEELYALPRVLQQFGLVEAVAAV